MDLNSLKGQYVDFLSKSDIDEIHYATLDILKNTGVKVFNESALKIFANAGADVNFETQIVKITSKIVEDAIEKTPAKFTWHARNPEKNLKMGGGIIHFSPAALCPFVYDLETGKRRKATYLDCVNLSRIADSLERISDAFCMVYPQDVPESMAHIYILKAISENSDKCIRGRINGIQIAKDSIRVAEILAKGDKNLADKPNMIALIDAVSPLQLDNSQVEGMIEYVKKGLPVIIACEITSGGTGPATLAGTLVLQNAEILSHMVLAQAIRPGTPLMYGTSSSVMDMRNANLRYGAVELGMINVATAQLARYYKIPSRGAAGFTDAKVLDMQAGYEVAITLLIATLGGVNLILQTVGGLDLGMSVSYEKIVIDHEILGSIVRAMEGIRVDPEALAVDVIKSIGPGGHFLSHPHTLENFKKEHFIPLLADTDKYSIWEKKGRKEIKDRAKEQVKKILQAYEPKPLDKPVQEELDLFVREVERRAI